MAGKSARTFNLNETAAILGVTRQTLGRWIDLGAPVITKADRSQAIEWVLSVADIHEWRLNRAVADAVAKFDSPTGAMTKEEADRRRAVAQAIAAEADLDQALRRVVPIADVADLVTKEYAAIRTHLQSVGSKIAGRAASMNSAPAIQELVDEAVIDALEGLTYDRRLAEQQPSRVD